MFGQLCVVLDCVPLVHANARLALNCISVTVYAVSEVEPVSKPSLVLPLLQLKVWRQS